MRRKVVGELGLVGWGECVGGLCAGELSFRGGLVSRGVGMGVHLLILR